MDATLADSGSLVLVVDDDDRSRELLRLILRRAGHRVLSAADAQAAVALLAAERPAAVVADLLMPGMSGLDFCRWIRAQPALQATAFVLLTGLDTLQVRAQASAAGADALITKPFDRTELLATLGSSCESRGGTSAR